MSAPTENPNDRQAHNVNNVPFQQNGSFAGQGKSHYENIVRCPICFYSVNYRSPRATTCGHIYCAQCLNQALEMCQKCPVCEANQEYRNTFPIYL